MPFESWKIRRVIVLLELHTTMTDAELIEDARMAFDQDDYRVPMCVHRVGVIE